MKLVKLIAATAILGAAAPAMAQDNGGYVNVGVEAFDFLGTSWNLTARGGIELAEYFAIEGEGRVGVIDGDFDFKTSVGFAGYGVVKLPASESFDLFARAGYHYTDTNFGDGDGFAFGAGAQFNFGDDYANGIRLEYTNLDGDGGSADTFGISYVRKF